MVGSCDFMDATMDMHKANPAPKTDVLEFHFPRDALFSEVDSN